MINLRELERIVAKINYWVYVYKYQERTSNNDELEYLKK